MGSLIFDLVLLVIVISSVLHGIARGIWRELLALAGLILGIYLAASYFGVLAPNVLWLTHNVFGAQIIAFLLILIAVVIVFRIIAAMLRSLSHAVGLGWLDRLLGGFFGLIRGILAGALAAILAVLIYPQAPWVTGSRVAPHLVNIARQAATTVFPPFAERVREGLHQLGSERFPGQV